MHTMNRIAYGLTNHIPAFRDQTPRQIGDRLRGMGCDGVFLKHLDPAWVDGLHAAGLAVYISQPIFLATDDLWAHFPHSRPILPDGSPAPVQEWYRPALPADDDLRAYRLAQLTETLTALPVDGVWLDFIRWPARWETPSLHLYDSSFDPRTVARFFAATGRTLPENPAPPAIARLLLHELADDWFAWRSRQIASFVAEARTVVECVRPGSLLGLFTVPWTGDAALDRTGVKNAHIRITGQDPALLGPLADVLSPMVYHRLCGRDPGWTGQVMERIVAQVPCPVWPVIEALPDDPGYDCAEFAQALSSAAQAGGEGVIVFKVAGLSADPGKMKVWKANWEIED
jgi:hypothetical protein